MAFATFERSSGLAPWLFFISTMAQAVGSNREVAKVCLANSKNDSNCLAKIPTLSGYVGPLLLCDGGEIVHCSEMHKDRMWGKGAAVTGITFVS